MSAEEMYITGRYPKNESTEKVTHKTELAADGLEKIEAKIQKIETLAHNGIFAQESRTARFHQVALEVKQLRQIIRDVPFIVPVQDAASADGKGDVA